MIYNKNCSLYLQFLGIKVLQVLLWQDLIKALEERLSLFLNASGQPPLSNQPATCLISQSLTDIRANMGVTIWQDSLQNDAMHHAIWNLVYFDYFGAIHNHFQNMLKKRDN